MSSAGWHAASTTSYPHRPLVGIDAHAVRDAVDFVNELLDLHETQAHAVPCQLAQLQPWPLEVAQANMATRQEVTRIKA